MPRLMKVSTNILKINEGIADTTNISMTVARSVKPWATNLQLFAKSDPFCQYKLMRNEQATDRFADT